MTWFSNENLFWTSVLYSSLFNTSKKSSVKGILYEQSLKFWKQSRPKLNSQYIRVNFTFKVFPNEGTIQRKNYVNQPVLYVKYFSFPELVLRTDEPFRYMRIILCFEFNFFFKKQAENQKKSKNPAENQKKSKKSRKPKNI